MNCKYSPSLFCVLLRLRPISESPAQARLWCVLSVPPGSKAVALNHLDISVIHRHHHHQQQEHQQNLANMELGYMLTRSDLT